MCCVFRYAPYLFRLNLNTLPSAPLLVMQGMMQL
jgi:hypothetical protein